MAKLRPSYSHITIMPYQRDVDSDGIIMPYHLFKIVFSMGTKEQLAVKNRSIVIKRCSKTIMLQSGICRRTINHKNK